MRRLEILINRRTFVVDEGTTVAAALWNADIERFRRSVRGAARGPICAMGICFECRVTIDGVPHRRACMEICRQGLKVETDD